ncbi:hypothetical protein HUJ04_011651 [Dendroctonus ponderosae]|nr:hypothetical protein HUJ04_011651 [Dendroctonus ponderosae]
MVNLKPGMEIREMFVKVPFPLSFNVYIFSVLNPAEVQGGAKPHLKEMGPFCYNEWKTKINVEDNEGDDMISYDPVDTFENAKRPKCLSVDTLVTIPHPMILGMVNTILRQKPGALTLANKAIKKMVQLENESKPFAKLKIFIKLAASLSLTANPNWTVWNNSKCDTIVGTDGTIFPPMLKKEEGLASFAPDLCRSLIAQFDKHDKYDGIPVSSFFASLGDQSKNPAEKCFCTTPETCLKREVHGQKIRGDKREYDPQKFGPFLRPTEY